MYACVLVCTCVDCPLLCTGWRRCIGCLKLQVSFCKRAANDRALLRKVTYKDKTPSPSSPPSASSPPCTRNYIFWKRCLELQVSFCKKAANHRVFLRKVIRKDKTPSASSLRCTRHFAQETMGWLRLVGSLKSFFSFAKEPCKRDYILQKRHIILRSLLIVATPYVRHESFHPIHGIFWERCLKMQVSFRKRATNYRALLWKMTHNDKTSSSYSPLLTRRFRLHGVLWKRNRGDVLSALQCALQCALQRVS